MPPAYAAWQVMYCGIAPTRLAWDVQDRSAMRCLITGGAGFIGSHLVEYLAGAGRDGVALDDFSTGRRENFAAGRRISFIRGSVTDLSTCRRAMEGAHYVLHHAGGAASCRRCRAPSSAPRASSRPACRL